MKWSDWLGAVVKDAFWVLLIIGMILFRQSNVRERVHEAALIEGGHCSVIARELYNPRAGALPGGDPYMRSLWRCSDPSRDGQGLEFWRRTSEEFGK